MPLVPFAIFLSGVLGILIHPTVLFGVHFPDFGFLAWVYLVPLFLILPLFGFGKRFLAAFLSACITYAGGLYWLAPAMYDYGGVPFWASVGILGLVVLMLAFGFAFFAALAVGVQRRTGLPLFLCYAVFLIVFEFGRTHGPFNGFPWIQPAYSQGGFLAYLQWVDVTGVHGLNLLVLLVNGLVAEMILPWVAKIPKGKVVNRAVVLVFVTVLSFYGSLNRQSVLELDTREAPVRTFALIQANIPQSVKWDTEREAENLNRHLELTALASQQGVELSIWPEVSFPYMLDLNTALGFQVFESDEALSPVLLGAVSLKPRAGKPDKPESLYNSAALLNNEYRIAGMYHKRHLVPFGEYVPMKDWLWFARRLTTAVGDFSPGLDAAPLAFGDLKLGMLICYEDIFPYLSRQSVLKGANVLVNMTNDAWYGDTSAQHQHLVFSQFRALENRRYLARTTNTGVTALIDQRGIVLESLPPFQTDILLASVRPQEELSPYTRYGDWVGWGVLGLAVLACVAGLLRKFKLVS